MSDTVVCENPSCLEDTGQVKGHWWEGTVTCPACLWRMRWDGKKVAWAMAPKKEKTK